MNYNKIHFIGIGGISMSAIAEFFLSRGIKVTGSDRTKSDITQKLENLGAKITYSHIGENITDQDLIIKTSAIKDDNPEIICAKQKNIKIIERADAIGELMLSYKNVVCVSGTHGKTSTTSMISYMSLENKTDPTIMVGSYLDVLNGSLRIGSNNLFINESCEYCNSFLSFKPTIAIINNIEADHLDFFKDINDIINSFSKFADLVPANGCIIYNNDDDNVIKSVENLQKNKLSFGIYKNSDVMAKNIKNNCGYYSFDLFYNGKMLQNIILSTPGIHNIYNALASLSASIALNFDIHLSKKALENFTGSNRRFQKKGYYNNALIVDDYAHHPTEIETTLKSAQQMGFKRVICVFQSHTYTRTKLLFNEFVNSLKLCDLFISTEIYSAREVNESGISGKDLSDKIENSIFLETFEDVENYLKKELTQGDLLITMGAGDVYIIGENLVNLNKTN